MKAGESAIRIAKAKDFTPAPYTVMGREVSDIEAVVRWLNPQGVAFEKYRFVQDRELGIWTAPGGGSAANIRVGERPVPQPRVDTGIGHQASPHRIVHHILYFLIEALRRPDHVVERFSLPDVPHSP
jgi:hypothetical protein